MNNPEIPQQQYPRPNTPPASAPSDNSKPMGRAKKAAMLSAAVFPGAGQIYNGQKIKGAAVIVLTIGFVVLFGYKVAVGFSSYFTTALLYSEVYIKSAPQAPTAFGRTLLEGVIFGALPAVALWILATLDAYRTGRKLEYRAKRGFTAYK